jgi:hypothetical protein
VSLRELFRFILRDELGLLAHPGVLHMERSTHIEPIPLLLSVACGCSGLMNGRIYPNTHLQGAAGKQQRQSKEAHQALEPLETRGAGEFRALRLTPRSRLALAGVCFWVEAERAN